jgi:hypothetical protein
MQFVITEQPSRGSMTNLCRSSSWLGPATQKPDDDEAVALLKMSL